jgi:exopolysaccharide biosynthesis polyprenyl glycosylphosphotransferase
MSRKIEKIVLLLTDFLMINLAFYIYFTFRVESGLFEIIILPEFFLPMIVLYIYWLIIFTFVGMYQSWFAASRFDELSTLFKATFVGIFILFFFIFLDDYINNVSSNKRILIFIYWGFLVLLVGSGRVIIRSIQRELLVKGYGRKSAIIIGYNPKAFEVIDSVADSPALGIDIKSFCVVKERDLNKEYRNIKVEAKIDSLPEMIDKYNAQEIILALEDDEHEIIGDVIPICDDKNCKLKIVPDLYEILSGQARTSQLYGVPLIDVMPELMPEWEKKLKRILDITLSIIILIITLPLTLLTAFAIKLDSEGPVFFIQERMGQNGKIFKMIKFRSMRKDAEKHTGPVWSQKDDPRVTRVGKIIRKVRIDEIPQFINVLKGDMSIVGPRPERPYFVEKLSQEIPYYKRRLRVRPGITGWAQVKHKYDESIEDVKIKLRYDLFYIENMSIRMDLKILFRTIFVVLFGKGHYE